MLRKTLRTLAPLLAGALAAAVAAAWAPERSVESLDPPIALKSNTSILAAGVHV